jgi:nucleoside-diphosphate-sugar epimerase
MSTRRAFVTGASGFVGGHLCERLRAEGWQVTALVRAGSRRGVLERCGCQFAEGDLFATNVIARAAERSDAVFHLAAVVRASTRAQFQRANAEGTERFAEGITRSGFAGPMVVLSSLAAGGPAVAGRARTEQDRDAPVSLYGESKLAAEKAIMARPRPFSAVAIRPGPIYGPREVNILALLVGMARTGLAVQLGGGVTVQMTHVRDVVDSLLAAVPLAGQPMRRFYAVERRAWPFSEVAAEVGRQLGRRIRLVSLPIGIGWIAAGITDGLSMIAGRPVSPLGLDKVRELRAGAWLGDPGAFEAASGWRARVTFEEGLADTLAWARSAGRIR